MDVEKTMEFILQQQAKASAQIGIMAERQAKAANDYHGHKANAIGYIDKALGELQTCMSMP